MSLKAEQTSQMNILTQSPVFCREIATRGSQKQGQKRRQFSKNILGTLRAMVTWMQYLTEGGWSYSSMAVDSMK